MTVRIPRFLRLFIRDSATARGSVAPLPRPHPAPRSAPQTSSVGWGFQWSAPSRKTVLSRGFASGAFAYSSVPARNETKNKVAVVGSCAGGGVDAREVRRITMMAIRGWRSLHTDGKCERCNSTLGDKKEGGAEVPAKPPETAMVKSEKARTAVVATEKPPVTTDLDEHGPEGWRSRIAHMHRPTRDEMLAAATSFLERLRIITKWSMIRQMRPYTFDEIAAFFSWIVLGQILWILLGTTTFMSVLIYLANTVSAQEFLAKTIGNYLTKETGTRVVFESAIVPRWKDGCIQFKNVFVSRRPGSNSKVYKGSAGVAAAAAQAAITADQSNPDKHYEEDDGNYTQFDVTIDTVNVTISLARWMNGKGLLSACEIKGVRGVVDRTHVHWEPDVDPASYKHEHAPGDFEIMSFKLEDVLVTLYQPEGFRPFNISIFSADLPQLRKQWLFYDFLSANHMSGSYDDSLFTIHPRQGPTVFSDSPDGPPSPWKKTNRLRIDGLKIDHLNRGIEGPFSWITSANVDLVCDVTFPSDSSLDFSEIVSELVSRVGDSVSSSPSNSFPTAGAGGSGKYCHVAMSVNLNDVRAAVPLFPKELSYINIALIRPIVAYLNSRRGAYIPVSFSVIKPLDNFDGSWSIFDCGLMDDLSAETYVAFVQSVSNQEARKRRIKRVGLWTLQVIAQIIGLAMAGNLA